MKNRKGLVLATHLASVASEASKNHFQRHLRLMKDLTDCWKIREVGLAEIDCEMEL